jgi:murein DD-endopeptidase MepM/ murein hydrolase activator NlpD
MSQTKHLSFSGRLGLALIALVWLQICTPDTGLSSFEISGAFAWVAPTVQTVQTIQAFAPTALRDLFDLARPTTHLQHVASLPLQQFPRPRQFRVVSVKTSVQSRHSKAWPVRGHISSGFGFRIHPVTRRRSFHAALDIKCFRGTPVYSPADGVVITRQRAGLNGNLVKIDCGNGTILYFAHLSAYRCIKGQRIKKGQLIGLVGATGRATGPHLHFAVRKNGRFINPLQYLE